MLYFLYRKSAENRKISIAIFLKIRYILYRKYIDFRKTAMRLTEEQIVQFLKNTNGKYAPLMINCFQEQVSFQDGFKVDAIMDCSIQGGPSFTAIVEIKTVATPQNILMAARQLAAYFADNKKLDKVPLLVAPYIGIRQAKILADNGISWLDLSGNMTIRVSNRIYIERTGKPNRYPDTAPIKKIFQGTSSLVSRALLLKPAGFSTLYEIVDFINNRNAKVTLSTVSKVLKKLEEELLVDRSKSLISVADPEKLLERLAEGYRNLTERKRRNTYRFVIEGIEQMSDGMTALCKDYLACGFYAAQIKGLAVTDQKTLFVKDIEQFRRKAERKLVSITADEEFGNSIITETSDPGVWFNPDWRVIDSVVDDIELYLEMMVDTPRGPKIAEQLKQRILQKGDVNGQKAD
jgi:DNA-binding MarR family transcriptional regulator